MLIEKIPFLVLTAVSSVITFLVQRGAMPGIDVFPSKIKFANAVISYIRYIGKLFVPQNLAVFYPFDADRFPYWQIVFCALLLLGISILAIYLGRKHRYLPVGWFWFVGTLVPVIGFVQVGMQSMADRYSYIPYIGLFIIIAWGSPELLSKWRYRKIVLGIAAVMVLMAMGTGTYLQVGYWKNGSALFTHAIEVTQDNYIAFNNLGDAYRYYDRYQDAIEAYNQAIKINPDSADAYCCRGASYIKLGRYQDAIESYRRAIRIKPYWAEAHYNLGVAYGSIGSFQEEIESYKQAISIKPDYADAHYNLGVACGFLGLYQDAIDSFKQAIRFKPDYADAHYNLGVTYLTIGDKDSAVQEYKILKILGAKHADQLYNLIQK